MRILSTICVAATVLLTGCDHPDYVRNNVEIVNIDGCQYVLFTGSQSWCLTHKGNCTNNIHVYNK